MTRHIVVAIEPHEDGRCGECRWRNRPIGGEECGLYREKLMAPDGLYAWENLLRCTPCLAAEAKLTALISAGMVLARRNDDEYVEEWDRAVAEVRK